MTYRNHILVALAALAPRCMCCNHPNDGTVVSAHSNQGRDGKGMGLKASDAAIAFCCHLCHSRIDQGREAHEVRFDLWEMAHRATMRWLIESGHLVASVEPQAPPEPPQRPKRAIPARRAVEGSSGASSGFPEGRKIETRGFEKRTTPHQWPKRSFPKRAKP